MHKAHSLALADCVVCIACCSSMVESEDVVTPGGFRYVIKFYIWNATHRP